MQAELANISQLPLFPLRELAPFPCDLPIFPLYVGRQETLNLLSSLGLFIGHNAAMFVCTMRNPTAEASSDLASFNPIGMVSVFSGAEFIVERNAHKILMGGVFPAKLKKISTIKGHLVADFEITNRWFPVATMATHWKEINDVVLRVKQGLNSDSFLRQWGIQFQGANAANTCFNLLSSSEFTLQDRLGILQTSSVDDLVNYTITKLRELADS